MKDGHSFTALFEKRKWNASDDKIVLYDFFLYLLYIIVIYDEDDLSQRTMLSLDTIMQPTTLMWWVSLGLHGNMGLVVLKIVGTMQMEHPYSTYWTLSD